MRLLYKHLAIVQLKLDLIFTSIILIDLFSLTSGPLQRPISPIILITFLHLSTQVTILSISIQAFKQSLIN